jgi:hypothetical protein
MKSGIDFVRDRVDAAVAMHAALLDSMSNHESEADDSRYRDLCDRYLPRMRDHQCMLEDLRTTLGPDQDGVALRKPVGRLADTRTSDYERLEADLDLARRLEVVFKTFRDAGRALRIEGLASFGEIAERHHDDYSADAKRLLLQMFMERADRVTEVRRRATDSRADSRIR